MPDNIPEIEPYAAAVRKLLQGVVYHDDHKTWQQVRDYEWAIRDYLGRIGLGLRLDEIGNFAYLEELTRDDDGAMDLPALTQRRSLTFSDTLLLVLLRERLDEHEVRDVDGVSLRLRGEEMAEMIGVFMGEHPDARKLEQSLSSSVNRLVRYGYLKDEKNGSYLVRPVVRAKVSADVLDDMRAKLVAYVGENTPAEDHDSQEDDDHDEHELI